MISNKFKLLKKFNKPTYVVLIICLLLVAFNIILDQHIRTYNSDDVSWQNTLLTWRPFSGVKAYVGAQDNFIVNIPFILIADLVAGPGRTALLLASLFMAIVNFILFYIACIYFIKRLGIERMYSSLLPFAWLASFGIGLTSLYLNTVWRDYEIGISFIFFALAAMYYGDEVFPFRNNLSKLGVAVTVLIGGAFIQSDKYFLYFTVAPIILFFIFQYINKKTNLKKLMTVLSVSTLTFIVSRVISKIASEAGLVSPKGSHRLNGLYDISGSLKSFLKGIEDIFGMTYNGKITIWLIPNMVLVFLIILILFSNLSRSFWRVNGKNIAVSIWSIFFSLVTILVIVADLVLDQGGIFTYRYLVLVVYTTALLIAISTNFIKKFPKALILILLITAVSANIIISIVGYNKTNTSNTKPNASNIQLIAEVRKLGLRKGYAGYWDANINSYLSNNLEFLPITCTKSEKTIPLPLLVNAGLYKKQSLSSFIILDSSMNPPLCSQSSVEAQFGKPIKTLEFDKKTILVFSYDIVSKMDSNFPT